MEVTDTKEKALGVTLLRSAQIEAGSAEEEGIKLQRKVTLEYALCLGKMGKMEAMVRGEAFRSGLRSHAFEQNPEAGGVESRMAMLEMEGNKLVSTVYEETGYIYVRLYDVSGKGETARLRFAGAVCDAEYVNLDHRTLRPAVVEDQTVPAECPAHGIATIRVKMKK